MPHPSKVKKRQCHLCIHKQGQRPRDHIRSGAAKTKAKTDEMFTPKRLESNQLAGDSSVPTLTLSVCLSASDVFVCLELLLKTSPVFIHSLLLTPCLKEGYIYK